MSTQALDDRAGSFRALEQVRKKLDAGAVAEALELLGPIVPGDPLLRNARGVCLMRLGRIREAVEVFRGLALWSGTSSLNLQQPTVVLTNFATALLLDGNVRGCLAILAEIKQDDDPAVIRLRDSIAVCRSMLGRWERFKFSAYGILKGPIDLGFPPGELLLSEPASL